MKLNSGCSMVLYILTVMIKKDYTAALVNKLNTVQNFVTLFHCSLIIKLIADYKVLITAIVKLQV